MKENLFQALLYIYENAFDEEGRPLLDSENLSIELYQAGFNYETISKAFGWLEGILDTTPRESVEKIAISNRVFTTEECDLLDNASRGLLLDLEHLRVIDWRTRELIIDRAIALETEDLDFQRMKWVTLMVLSYQKGQEATLAWLENIVFNEASQSVH